MFEGIRVIQSTVMGVIMWSLAFSLCGLVIFLGCFASSSDQHRGASSNIRESQERGVFISEMVPVKSEFQFLNSLEIKVKTAWVEKRWMYGDGDSETLVDSGYQLIVKVEDGNLSGYSDTWTIGKDGRRYFRQCAVDCIMTDLPSLPNRRESWMVRHGYKLKVGTTVDSIGVFELSLKE